MKNDKVIEVSHVSKKFCLNLSSTLQYGVIDLTKNLFRLKSRSDRLRPEEFWAVNDISFQLKKGEILGIIGPNGSGKSTLLKLLSGILAPDKGVIKIRGKVGALIEIGAGFHPMLTGRENIYINGTILDMNRKEIDEKFDEIVNFADIGNFLDVPVKNYSSGMYARLGFSIAIHSEPDILLIDEILSVGDLEFQQKSFNKIQEHVRKGITIILVTHSLHTIRFMSTKVMLLKKGKQDFLGDPNQAVQYYQQSVQANAPVKEKSNFEVDKGSNQVKIKSVEIYDFSGRPKRSFHSNEGIQLKIAYFAGKDIKNPVLGFAIIREDGLNCFGGTTAMKKINIASLKSRGWFTVKIPKIYLNSGAYRVLIVVFNNTLTIPYGAELLGNFKVVSDYPRTGKSCPAFAIDYEIIL